MSRDVWRTGEIVPDAGLWAAFMGYPSVKEWANGRQYEGRVVRGMLRRSGYSQPCNAVAGEIG